MAARFVITKMASPDETVAQLVPQMAKLGNAIAVRMQRLVPKRTWALHDTIATDTQAAGSKVVTQVGAGGGSVDYALYVERGTSRMSAQPYMRPALLQSKATDFKFDASPGRHGVTRQVSRPARRMR